MQTAKENELFTRLNKFSTENILNLWNETEKQITNKYIYDVRDNIMKVLEVRHPNKYNLWMDAEHPNDNINTFFKGVCNV